VGGVRSSGARRSAHPATGCLSTGVAGEPGIGDYGFLSDCSTAALVSRAGSVDWWCVPRFDEPSVFGRLLGPEAGAWTLGPAADAMTRAGTGAVTDLVTTRSYLDDTLVLRTVHETPTGTVAVTDALALERGARGHDVGVDSPHVLVRVVEGLAGTVAMTTELAARPEYGLIRPHLRRIDDHTFEAFGGPLRLVATGPVPWRLEEDVARAAFDVREGERVELRVGAVPAFPRHPLDPGDVADEAAALRERGDLDDTIEAWRSWAADHVSYDGEHPALVRRSSLVLRGLTYARSGAVIAAATTSLPGTAGDADTWDYRYAWVRDLSVTARALAFATCPDEPLALLRWLSAAVGHLDGLPEETGVQIVYGVGGERDLTERTLDHLPGFGGTGPVHVGNAAYLQTQLDVLGEVLDAAHLLLAGDGSPDDELEPWMVDLVAGLADRAARLWRRPDAGMWEARDAERHYTSSKVMCWVALDRAVALAPRLGSRARPQEWAQARDAVRAAVLDEAWSESSGAYAGAFGSDELDASVLLLPLVGFLDVRDPRMAATVELIEAKLGDEGLVRRWAADPGGFVLCTYWLVECLAMAGHDERARALFDLATSRANDLGLLAEEADPRSGAPLGNVPQAFSHVGLINAAWRLAHPRDGQRRTVPRAP
jgi:GH15 family glucan-1,4-alpha-glucosidase